MSIRKTAFYLLATIGCAVVVTVLTLLGAGVFSLQFWLIFLGILAITVAAVNIITEED